MKQYELNTQLFGSILVPIEEGFMEDYVVTIGGKQIPLTLNVEENLMNGQNINIVDRFFQHIPEMYAVAKKYMIQHMNSNEIIKFFIKSEIEEVEELCELFNVETNNDITYEMYVDKLEPRMISLAKNTIKNIVDCTFDFSMPEEYSDELLVIRFDDKYNVYDVTHES